ncbi:O-antigen ligase family protein [Heyndrickxia coagulans]|uniref:O-antigen ligase-related domain-containing protein n=1 Tax=Heyndrickxia coagulans TaxID=1398 RepID=A0A150KBS7_HEYCO|nr:O-antigen ligase family protein [Heyndrickxia coagulans]KYC67055.1 hypothetical protein B4099_1049 [Heyndrickxia coagulans]
MKISLEINLRNIIIFISSIIVMFFGNLITNYTIDPETIKNKWLVEFILAIILIFYTINIKFSKQKLLFVFMWELFVFCIFFSKLLNESFNFFELIFYSICIPLTFFSFKIKKYKNILLFAFIISILPFFYLLRPESLGTGNNNLGIMFSIGGIASLNFLRNIRINNKLFYMFILFYTVVIYLTRSRTSLIAFIIVALIYFISILLRKELNFYSYFKKISLMLFTLIITFYLVNKFFISLLFGKWNGTSNDITSGREEFWSDTVENGMTYFGNGENYFLKYNVRDAHNIFFQILGDYGLISLIFFLLIFIFIVYKLVKTKKIEYLCFFCGFFILGCAENLFFINSRLISIHLIFFMYLGCLIEEKNKDKIKNKSSINKNKITLTRLSKIRAVRRKIWIKEKQV